MKIARLLLLISAGLMMSSCAKKEEYPVLTGGRDAAIDYITGECFDGQDQPLTATAKVKYFRENGQLAEEWLCQNGKINGTTKTYSENGKLYSETNFQNGQVIGAVRRYYESGKLLSETPYQNGKEDGIEKIYFESGKIQTEIPYKDGGVSGAIKGYYESGAINFEITTQSEGDINSSLEKIYAEDGKLQQETTCKGPLAEECVEKNFDSAGTMTSQRAYTKGPE
ncbi:MAG: toxin-antitoxin system YwqK family antitoxin [Burkholderiales bacterium]|jgi:antitoxin component YwqK of YwqJK toxin-antitoxin module|nr:toxin-antitoxin system YwqK family antitoxin [Burkholderiales bacterium]